MSVRPARPVGRGREGRSTPTDDGRVRRALGPAPIVLARRVAVPLVGLTLAIYGLVNLAATSAGVDLVGLVVIPLTAAGVLLSLPLAAAATGIALALTVVGFASGASDDALEFVGVVELVAMLGVALTLRAGLNLVAVSRTQQLKREGDLSARLGVILALGRRLGGTLDRAALFKLIVAEAGRHLQAEVITIRLIRADELELVAWSGIADAQAARLPRTGLDDAWHGPVVRLGRPIAHADITPAAMEPFALETPDGPVPIRGTLIAPLVLDGRVIGTLAAATREPRDWTPADLDFVAGLAAHAAVALNNAELFERSETRARQFAVLQAASRRLTSASTIAEVGRTVVEELGRILDYHNARVATVESTGIVTVVAWEGDLGLPEPVDPAAINCRVGEGLTGWVAEHAEPLLIGDAAIDPRAASIAGTDDVDESMLVVPMQTDIGVVGVITVSKLGLDQFRPEDLQLVTILAGQAGTAIESVRRLGRTTDLAAELRRLLDMSSELSQSLDSRQVAQLMAQHLAQAMGVDECVISYWDRGADRLLTLGYHPAARISQVDAMFGLAHYPETRRVLETGVTSTIDVSDPTADPAETALLRADGMRTLVMLPLLAKGVSIGLVELLALASIQLDEQRLALARTMANEAAMALENARLYEEARNLANRDPLTGFYNHRFLHERLGEEVLRARRSRRPISILMLDLDDFKLVNDSFGHQLGDRVLGWTAEKIRETLRGTDVPARYGGDEFAIVLPDTDAENARTAAARILEVFEREAFDRDGRERLPVAVSIGVATFPDDGATPTDLIAAADRRLYRAKAAGGQHYDDRDEPSLDRSPGAVA